MITGQTLIAWGYKPGKWFGAAIAAAERARQGGADEATIQQVIAAHMPPPVIPLKDAGSISYHLNIRPEGPGDAENIAAVERHMADLMRRLVERGIGDGEAIAAGLVWITLPA